MKHKLMAIHLTLSHLESLARQSFKFQVSLPHCLVVGNLKVGDATLGKVHELVVVTSPRSHRGHQESICHDLPCANSKKHGLDVLLRQLRQ